MAYRRPVDRARPPHGRPADRACHLHALLLLRDPARQRGDALECDYEQERAALGGHRRRGRDPRCSVAPGRAGDARHADRSAEADLVRDATAVGAVAIEAATTLSPVVAGIDQLAEQRRRGESRVMEPLVEHAADIEMGVEADKIGELEWAHGVV